MSEETIRTHDPLTVTASRSFRSAFTADGYYVSGKLLAEDELKASQVRVSDILAGKSSFPLDAQDGERGPAGQGSHPVVRKLKDLARNDSFFLDLARHERIVDRVEEILGPDIKLHASIGWMKPPRVGSPKSPHQDSAYWTHVVPPEFVICWIALDDATPENGCLNFLPGSHLHGIVPHALLDELRVPPEAVPFEEAVAAPVPAGGATFHFGTTLHWSGPNLSDRPRRALSFAYMSARSRLEEQLEVLRGNEKPGS